MACAGVVAVNRSTVHRAVRADKLTAYLLLCGIVFVVGYSDIFARQIHSV